MHMPHKEIHENVLERVVNFIKRLNEAVGNNSQETSVKSLTYHPLERV